INAAVVQTATAERLNSERGDRIVIIWARTDIISRKRRGFDPPPSKTVGYCVDSRVTRCPYASEPVTGMGVVLPGARASPDSVAAAAVRVEPTPSNPSTSISPELSVSVPLTQIFQ